MKRIRSSKTVGRLRFTSALGVCALFVILCATSGLAADEGPKVTLVFDHALPNVPGKSIKGVLVEYGPGSSSPAHTHPKSAFIYATVLEGAIRTSVNDGPVKIYRDYSSKKSSGIKPPRGSVCESCNSAPESVIIVPLATKHSH
jgi:hypothetical protein